MINGEKFKTELRELGDFAIRKDGTLCECDDINCGDCDGALCDCVKVGCKCCIFDEYEDCTKARMKWLVSEYKEKPVLSKFERNILEWVRWVHNNHFKYIARDENGNLYVYTSKPEKSESVWIPEKSESVRMSSDRSCYLTIFNSLFNFIKWEDAEPTSIKEILENCEVVENESNE